MHSWGARSALERDFAVHCRRHVISMHLRSPRGVLIEWWRYAAKPGYGIPSRIFFSRGGASEEGQRSVIPAAAHSPNPCRPGPLSRPPTSGFPLCGGTLAVHSLYTEPPAFSVPPASCHPRPLSRTRPADSAFRCVLNVYPLCIERPGFDTHN